MRSDTPAENAAGTMERASRGLKVAALGGIVFLHFPLLIVILYAFTTDRQTYLFPPPGLTMQWFVEIFSRGDFWQALVLSLKVAAAATALAVIPGTLTAAATYRGRLFAKESISLS